MKREESPTEINDDEDRPPPPPRLFAATPDVPTTVEDPRGGEATDTPRPVTGFDTLLEEGEVDEESSFIESVEVKRDSPPISDRPPSPVPGLMSQGSGFPFTLRTMKMMTSGTASAQEKPSHLGVPGEDFISDSKKSLVGDIQTDKIKKSPAATGRYRPIADDDFSLLSPAQMKDYVKSKSKLDTERSGPRLMEEPGKEVDEPKGLMKLFGKQKKKTTLSPTTEDSGKSSGGMASTIGFLTSVVKWKSKKQNKFDKNEKYPGYLELFNKMSRDVMTSVPLPLIFQARREAFSVVQHIAKAYKSTLGPHHAMTEQAMAKLEKLRSELYDDDVFI